MLIGNIVSKRLQALSWLPLLLDLIDCLDVIEIVKDGDSQSSARQSEQPKIVELPHWLALGRETAGSRKVVAPAGQSPTGARTEITNPTANDTGTARESNFSHDDGIVLLALEQARADMMSLAARNEPRPTQASHGGEPTDDNLLGAIKSVWLKLTARIKSTSPLTQHTAEPAASGDALGRQRPKRLSKSEIIQKILNDISIDSVPSGAKRLAAATSGTGSANSSSIDQPPVSETVSAERSNDALKRQENAPVDQRPSNDDQQGPAHGPNQRQPPSANSGNRQKRVRPSPPQTNTRTSGTRGGNDAGLVIKPSSDSFKENLSIILEDQLEELNTTSIDLDHLIKLHQQRLAKNKHFQPIDQLKKVMSFMHFG